MAPTYIVRRAAVTGPLLLDPAQDGWHEADVISWGAEPYGTSFRALWREDALHLRFDAADDAPWHTKTARDDRLWEEEVVEIFLDPARAGENYAEIEINPGNVVCDLLVRRPWPRLDSDPSWHVEGLETRVAPWLSSSSATKGWTATAYLPWRGLASLPGGARVPPREGDAWRFNVFRIKRPDGPQRADGRVLLFAWSPTGSPSFHVPAAFGDLVFA